MNRRIVDYKLVAANNSVVLEKEVLAELKKGWELLGGASDGGDALFQTMVKYEDADRQDITPKVFAPDGGE